MIILLWYGRSDGLIVTFNLQVAGIIEYLVDGKLSDLDFTHELQGQSQKLAVSVL